MIGWQGKPCYPMLWRTDRTADALILARKPALCVAYDAAIRMTATASGAVHP